MTTPTKINVQYEEGAWMEQLVVWRRSYTRVGRALDGQIVHIQVPAYYLQVVPF